MKRFIASVVIACIVMAIVELYLAPNYLVKSICKGVIFLVIPFFYMRFVGHLSVKTLFTVKWRNMKVPIIFAVGVSSIILLSYWIVGRYLDFSNVTIMLEENMAIEKSNFLFVAIYIAIINSLLEEFFFRGFAFLALMEYTTKQIASLFSASMFSLYHIAMMTNWFSIPLFMLILFCLFIAGLFFNKLDEKVGSILPSWLVHLSANVAINMIGVMLFEII
ncbi:CPBP family intramembrane glutamic endopeptidase [Gracilibacillus sp. S3-1-1]|uniref:CPBP family intramembrane glutamic endopeptidase n=1 Tax=Gracilibacillus pellucidus TaxID=3095368 RepID=A0ACC6M4M8_9BACI|nr:CPBP family intramembrane glutamic endopeptidase [Gracilibacillus sp. S3-1-1]MDX8045921.1 CPBP family intramembrane glutamic endopeptidase [Gracilibacillus sp. S3-1-1]